MWGRGAKQSTQPMEIVMIRHGQSEANVVQQAEKHGEIPPDLEKVYARHDFEHHLTQRGVVQAKAARAVLVQNGLEPEGFDECYVSPFVRTQETAAYIGNGLVDWLPEVRIIERDWGLYGATPLSERIERYAHTERRREISSFLTRYDNGENIPDVGGRLRDWVSTLNRDKTNQRILAVTHGELMWTARFVFEGLSPDEWGAMDKDKNLRIPNCGILWYSRRNPEKRRDISRTMTGGWRRMIDPYEPENSPYGGEWQKLPGRTRLNGAEMLAAAEIVERIADAALLTDDPSAAEGLIS